MNEFDLLFKEAEVAEAHYEYAASRILLEDTDYMESSGNNSENFFTKLTKAVKDFIDKIIKTVKGIFDKFTTSKTCEKAEQAMEEDPSLKNKKIYMTDWKKSTYLK